MQAPLEPTIWARLIFLGIGLLLVVPLGFLFGTWTYEGFSIHQAVGGSGTRIMVTLALYPLFLVSALTVLTQLGMLLLRLFRSGPVHPEYERGTSFRSLLWGTSTGYVLAVAAAAVITFRQDDLFWWPPVSFGVALIVALIVLVKRTRRFRQPADPAPAA